jgi:hypothetical protein
MTLQFQHSAQPDPDGCGPTPRTLRDTEHDPNDWLQDASNAPRLETPEDDEPPLRDPRVMEPRVVRLAVLIALSTLAIILGALYNIFG